MENEIMAKHDAIAQSLKIRLAELNGRLSGIEGELHTPLPADSEEQATDLENQDALEGTEKAVLHEIGQIEHALSRIEEGSYGICAKCGDDIGPKRLEVLPAATECIACAE
jgi:DnaK suppressor protein